MNKIKYLAAVLIAVAGLGLQQAKAGVITPLPLNSFPGSGSDGYQLPNQDQSTVLAFANTIGVDDFPGPSDNDLTVDVRLLTAGTVTNAFGTFTVTTVSTGVLTFSFSLNPGFVLAGLMLHDGHDGFVNFYSVNDETSGINEGPVTTPLNASGHPGGLSNFDFLLEAGGTTTVPDGGTTVMLLGAGLSALGMVRRFLKR